MKSIFFRSLTHFIPLYSLTLALSNKMTFEKTSEDFFLQLGPNYTEYAEIFNENGFTDVSTICTMQIEEDLNTMIPGNSIPLGHRRKIQSAIQNLKSAVTCNTNEGVESMMETKCIAEKSSMRKIQEKHTEKLSSLKQKLEEALVKLKEFDQFVPLPEPEGPYKNQTCSICHVRGHRADGNKDRSYCTKEQCSSWKFCGRLDKHKTEISRSKKALELEVKQMRKDINDLEAEKQKLEAFSERSQTSFMSIMKPRLKAIDPMKYAVSSNILMRDLLALKEFYK